MRVIKAVIVSILVLFSTLGLTKIATAITNSSCACREGKKCSCGESCKCRNLHNTSCECKKGEKCTCGNDCNCK